LCPSEGCVVFVDAKHWGGDRHSNVLVLGVSELIARHKQDRK
jgi:hypothetical protein